MSESSLLKRVEAATGPDREIDCLLTERERPDLTPAMRAMYLGRVPTGEYYAPNPAQPGSYCVAKAPQYTASLDAAIALVNRALPGWEWNVSGSEGSLGWAQVKRWDIVQSSVGNSPALALLAALLKATPEQSDV